MILHFAPPGYAQGRFSIIASGSLIILDSVQGIVHVLKNLDGTMKDSGIYVIK